MNTLITREEFAVAVNLAMRGIAMYGRPDEGFWYIEIPGNPPSQVTVRLGERGAYDTTPELTLRVYSGDDGAVVRFSANHLGLTLLSATIGGLK